MELDEYTRPLTYSEYLSTKCKKDSKEEKWLYGEYLDKFRNACPSSCDGYWMKKK